jgi:hypothetical protein
MGLVGPMDIDPIAPSAAQVQAAADGEPTYPDEPHEPGGAAGRLNWLRAAVLGADDGIGLVAGIVVGVAGALRLAARFSPLGWPGWLLERYRCRSLRTCR